MKQILFTVISLTLLVSSSVKSNEEKARDMIEPQIKAQLIKPESYEFAQLQLDSCFSNSKMSPEALMFMLKVAKLYNEYMEHISDAERAESSMTIYAPSYGYQDAHSKLQQKKYKEKMEKAQRKAAAVKEQILQSFKDNMELLMSMESPKREFVGWTAIFDYRAETAGGLKIMGQSLYFLNKDLTEITHSFSDEEMRDVDPDKIQDIYYDFEKELQEVFLGK